MAMHGDVLLDAARTAKTLTAMVATGQIAPMTPAEIQLEAATVADFMQKQGDFSDNPLWTLNAFAFTGDGDPDPSSRRSRTSSSWATASSTPTTPLASVTWGSA